jgi:hypothetical protein
MDRFCVIYRTGGTVNFQWHRSLGMSRAEALEAAAMTRTGGRPAHVERLDRSLAVGLPETFEV